MFGDEHLQIAVSGDHLLLGGGGIGVGKQGLHLVAGGAGEVEGAVFAEQRAQIGHLAQIDADEGEVEAAILDGAGHLALAAGKHRDLDAEGAQVSGDLLGGVGAHGGKAVCIGDDAQLQILDEAVLAEAGELCRAGEVGPAGLVEQLQGALGAVIVDGGLRLVQPRAGHDGYLALLRHLQIGVGSEGGAVDGVHDCLTHPLVRHRR